MRAVIELVHQLCAPLGYLHGEGIVHRDLKPSNIIIRDDGTPVIIDFGLATFVCCGATARVVFVGLVVFGASQLMPGESEVSIV